MRAQTAWHWHHMLPHQHMLFVGVYRGVYLNVDFAFFSNISG